MAELYWLQEIAYSIALCLLILLSLWTIVVTLPTEKGRLCCAPCEDIYYMTDHHLLSQGGKIPSFNNNNNNNAKLNWTGDAEIYTDSLKSSLDVYIIHAITRSVLHVNSARHHPIFTIHSTRHHPICKIHSTRHNPICTIHYSPSPDLYYKHYTPQPICTINTTRHHPICTR